MLVPSDVLHSATPTDPAQKVMWLCHGMIAVVPMDTEIAPLQRNIVGSGELLSESGLHRSEQMCGSL